MNRYLLAVVLLSVSALAGAQQALEVISLRYRTADQVLDTLRPLVEPGGTLTGQRNQLIVRTSAANLAEIRRALDAIDRPQRRLQISVRFDDAFEMSRRQLGASGSISNRGARIEGRAAEDRGSATERVNQRVLAMDGGRATIFTGQSRPVQQRQFIQTPAGVVSQEVTVVQETTSGFEVVPRLSGSMVSLDILASRAGAVTTVSTVSGRVGEWFELGAIDGSAAREQRGIGSTSSGGASESRRVWVKVDSLD
jgi:type II secretory pathway component GspD/PulD (secretin)